MRYTCCSMIPHPHVLFLNYSTVICKCRRIVFVSCPSRGLLLFLTIFKRSACLAPQGFCYRWSFRGNAAHDVTKPSGSGKAISAINTVAFELLIPVDAATDAVNPMYLLATAEDIHPMYATRRYTAAPSIWRLAAAPTRKECNACRLSSIPAAPKLVRI